MLKQFAVLALIGAVVSPAFGQEPKSFTYKKTKQADLEIVVHFPPGWKETDKRPGIVFFFGGGWTNGTIKAFEPQAIYLASRGMVAACADYRIKSKHGVTPKECVEDAKSAVRWLRQNAAKLGIDPNRIAASGGSAGGHLAACTALTPWSGGRRRGHEDFLQSECACPVLSRAPLRRNSSIDGADRERRGCRQGHIPDAASEER